MGFLEVLTVVLVTLKLTADIDWTWLGVFTPMLAGYGIIITIWLIFFGLFASFARRLF